MSFENPQIPEGINTSKNHPLSEFSTLIIGALAVVILLLVTLSWFGETLARKIPFETELKISQQFEQNTEQTELTTYLNNLAQRISAAMPLHDGYQIQLRYQEDETVNAFATLGGNVLLFQGLLQLLPHENALAMLLAHEIAHIQHRDPIVGLGRGILVQLGLASVMGYSPQADTLLGSTGLLHSLHFSREMERAADQTALQTLVKLYGHANGATDLFKILHDQRDLGILPEGSEFFSTHPLDQNRIDSLHQLAQVNNWQVEGTLTPLPDAFPAWISSKK